MTFEDYRNNKTKIKHLRTKHLNLYRCNIKPQALKLHALPHKYIWYRECSVRTTVKLTDRSKWERKTEHRNLTAYHKLYDYIYLYIILLQNVISAFYLKRDISVANGKELCLIINKTHAGNYNRLLQIKKKRAENLYLSKNTINFDLSRLHIPGIMAYTILFFYFIVLTLRYCQDNMPEMGKISCFSHKQVLITVY